MKIVIGGGAGFIGAPLGRALVAMGHKVTAADNLSTGFRSSRDKEVELAKGDIDQPRFLARIFDKVRPDLYVHLAGQKDVAASWEDPATDSAKTVGSFLGALGACRTTTVPRVLLVSTGEVLTPPEGGEEGPLDPLMPVRPLSPYGASHALCEFYLDSFSRLLPMKTLIARLAPVFGPGQTTVGEGGLIGLAIRQTLLKSSQNPPAIPGNGRRMRDYIFIDDAVEALLHLIIKDFRNRIRMLPPDFPFNLRTIFRHRLQDKGHFFRRPHLSLPKKDRGARREDMAAGDPVLPDEPVHKSPRPRGVRVGHDDQVDRHWMAFLKKSTVRAIPS